MVVVAAILSCLSDIRNCTLGVDPRLTAFEFDFFFSFKLTVMPERCCGTVLHIALVMPWKSAMGAILRMVLQ